MLVLSKHSNGFCCFYGRMLSSRHRSCQSVELWSLLLSAENDALVETPCTPCTDLTRPPSNSRTDGTPRKTSKIYDFSLVFAKSDALVSMPCSFASLTPCRLKICDSSTLLTKVMLSSQCGAHFQERTSLGAPRALRAPSGVPHGALWCFLGASRSVRGHPCGARSLTQELCGMLLAIIITIFCSLPNPARPPLYIRPAT